MEYIYKLNLPPVLSVLNENSQTVVSGCDERSFIQSYQCVDILKPEYLNISGYNFKISFMLYKPTGTVGNLHSDNEEFNVEDTTWAINWIHGGNSQMKYWNRSRLGEPTSWSASHRYSLLQWPREISEADKSYFMYADCAYLVNTTVPHLPISLDNRYALSIRSFDHPKRTWDQVVAAFSELIVK